jgi:hypothetical protein
VFKRVDYTPDQLLAGSQRLKENFIETMPGNGIAAEEEGWTLHLGEEGCRSHPPGVRQ